MSNWREILDEIKNTGSSFDVVRRKYLKELSDYSKRNVIIYYSGWLNKAGTLVNQEPILFQVNDNDKNGFMATIHKLDRKKGLDLILHTPGGDIAATESLVHYLKHMFGNDIRAIIPQISLSAGTMIACACREIIMGKHSSLGPIDPQFGNIPAHGVIEEFKRARDEIEENPSRIPVWQPILAKYSPTLIGECAKAIEWSTEMVSDWLKSCMFENDPDKESKIKVIINELSDHALTKSHARHIPFEKAEEIKLNVKRLEDDPQLQEKVLTVHHTVIHTLTHTGAVKIIENQEGVAFVNTIEMGALLQRQQ